MRTPPVVPSIGLENAVTGVHRADPDLSSPVPSSGRPIALTAVGLGLVAWTAAIGALSSGWSAYALVLCALLPMLHSMCRQRSVSLGRVPRFAAPAVDPAVARPTRGTWGDEAGASASHGRFHTRAAQGDSGFRRRRQVSTADAR